MNRLHRSRYITLLITLMTLGSVGGGAAYGETSAVSAQIAVRQTAAVGVGPITLGDIARIRGDDAGGLAALVIREGGDRDASAVTLEDVRAALQEAGVNPAAVTLTGYVACELVRQEEPADAPLAAVAHTASANPTGHAIAAVPVDPVVVQPTLPDQIRAALAAAAGVEPAALIVDWTQRDEATLMGPDMNHMEQAIELVQERLNARPRVLLRPTRDATAAPIELRPTLRQRARAAVLTRAVRRGDLIPADSIELAEVVVPIDARPLSRAEDLVGQRAARALGVGEPVERRDLEVPLLIRRGELITVEATAGSLIIRTVARAMSDGGDGEVVRLRNEGTREEYTATVAARRLARVEVTQD